MVRDEVEKLKEEPLGNDNSIFSRIKKSNNLIIQGYTFAMLSDQSNGKRDWIDLVIELKNVDPLTMCVLFDKFLNKLNDNRQKIKIEMIEKLLKLFSSMINVVPEMDNQDFQSLIVLLLDQASDLKHFLGFLNAIHESDE